MNGRKSLRTRFLNWLGITTNDDFLLFADDVLFTLEAFEKYTKLNTNVVNQLCKETGIFFMNGNVYRVEEVGKDLKETTDDSINRGEL